MKNKYTKPNLTAKSTPIGGVPAGLKHIEVACDFFAVDYSRLIDQAARLDRELNIVRGNHMPVIRNQAATVARNRAQLYALIDANRPLFQSPKTRIFSDIKVGLQKQKGSTVVVDEDKTIELIAKHLPKRLDELAPVSRKVSKDALKMLTGEELKKIGVEIKGDTDEVIIKPQDSDVEKAVAALLKDCGSRGDEALKQAA